MAKSLALVPVSATADENVEGTWMFIFDAAVPAAPAAAPEAASTADPATSTTEETVPTAAFVSDPPILPASAVTPFVSRATCERCLSGCQCNGPSGCRVVPCSEMSSTAIPPSFGEPTKTTASSSEACPEVEYVLSCSAVTFSCDPAVAGGAGELGGEVADGVLLTEGEFVFITEWALVLPTAAKCDPAPSTALNPVLATPLNKPETPLETS
mmetsp:Transcript_34982/g.51234  ORF Transcript_34982/g.51234 Transcript_34982/m.51234 type:complete len:212 (-) Transcript_34982:1369-2004(-)